MQNKVTLSWTKAAWGYEATGRTNRYYSIVRQGTRFRIDSGVGYIAHDVGTLRDLKGICEEAEQHYLKDIAAGIEPNPNADDVEDEQSCPFVEPTTPATATSSSDAAPSTAQQTETPFADPEAEQSARIWGMIGDGLKELREGKQGPPFAQVQMTCPPAAALTATTSPTSLLVGAAASTAEPGGSLLAAKLRERVEARVVKPAAPVVKPAAPAWTGGPVAGMTPTAEQADILLAALAVQALSVKDGPRVLVVGAGAGSGKTAQLRMLEQLLYGQGQYTAFNAPLVAEGKTKFVKAKCNTYHSIAYAAVGRLYAHRLNGNRIKSEQVASILGIEDMELVVAEATPEVADPVTGQVKRLARAYLAGQVLVAVRKFCSSDDRELTDKYFRYIDGIDKADGEGRRGYANNQLVRDYLLPKAKVAWQDLSNTDGQLPFSHDIYMKIWALGTGENTPYIPADYLLCDEDQDVTAVFSGVLKKQTHLFLILVGDENQRIYEWLGTVNASKEFPTAPKRLLSQSFRFGQAVADVANSVLSHLDEKTDLVLKGLPSIPSRVAKVAAPRCVLCRTNAGAVSTVLASLKEGKRAHLVGGGADVVDFVRAARDLQSGRATRHPELCCFSSWGEVETYAATDEGEDLKLLVRLIKEFTCKTILEALEHMPTEADADLVVCTSHKSKGREWDTVRLAADFPPSNKMGDADVRLLYVACTRAKEVLDITDCTPFVATRDREGNPIRPVQVTYTVPMPTEEELEAYQRSKAPGKLTDREVRMIERSKAPVTPAGIPDHYGLKELRDKKEAAATNGNGAAGNFTWANVDGGWKVRGPRDCQGQEVTVTRRDGSTSVKVLKGVSKKMGDLWFYEVA